ncbi:hypothetical protein D917_08611, partial [Trichinella nativa]
MVLSSRESLIFTFYNHYLPRHLTCLYMSLNVSLPSKLKKYRKFVESDSEDDLTRIGEDTRISQEEKILARRTDKTKSTLPFE